MVRKRSLPVNHLIIFERNYSFIAMEEQVKEMESLTIANKENQGTKTTIHDKEKIAKR